MPTQARPNLLRRLLGWSAPEPETDAGDMGTAIGMEYSMDQAPLEPVLRQATPNPAANPGWPNWQS
jgi:hypothetical protein